MNAPRSVPDPDFVLRGHSESVSSVACGDKEDFSSLLSGSSKGNIWLWDLRIRRMVDRANMTEAILGANFISSDRLICHARDGMVQIFDRRSLAKPTDQFSIGPGTFCPVSTIYKGDDILIGAPVRHSSEVNVTNLTSKTVVAKLKAKENLGMVMQLRLFKDIATDVIHLAVGYEDGSVLLWNVEDGTEVSRLRVHEEPVMALDVNELKSTVAVGSATAKLCLVQFPLGEHERMLETTSCQLKTAGLGCLTFREDRKLLAAGSWNGRVFLFGSTRLKPLAALKYHTDSVNALCFWPDGRFAAASKDCKISLWSLYRV